MHQAVNANKVFSGYYWHRRRLVINIGGAKIWVTNIGGKNIWQIYFQTKNLEKFPSILSKISDDFLL